MHSHASVNPMHHPPALTPCTIIIIMHAQAEHIKELGNEGEKAEDPMIFLKVCALVWLTLGLVRP